MTQVVFCESGHGLSSYYPDWWKRKDPGACANGLTEREITVDMGRLVIDRLKTKFPTILIQGVGVETEAKLSAKTKYVNDVIKMNNFDKDNCLMVSLHMNSDANPKATGTECWYSVKSKAYELAKKITKNIAFYGLVDRGAKITSSHHKKRLYIDDVVCPAVLIEMMFISNPQDITIVDETRKRLRIADAIVEAIADYITHK